MKLKFKNYSIHFLSIGTAITSSKRLIQHPIFGSYKSLMHTDFKNIF